MDPNNMNIVFDMDDVLWDMNRKATEIAGIDINKLTTFSLYENENLTQSEKERLLAAYTSAELFKDITFYEDMVALVNCLNYMYPDVPVMISSNCSSEEIKNVKLKQLLSVLDLPENRILLHVIDVTTQSKQKQLPDNMFLFIDDSTHNVAAANAKHIIMPAKPWNNIFTKEYPSGGCINGRYIDRPEGTKAVTELVRKYMMEKNSDSTRDFSSYYPESPIIGTAAT